MNVVLSHFGGIIPRLAEHMLGPNQATVAHDVRLNDGRIEAWREPRELVDSVVGAKTLYEYGCCWLTWPDIVSCANIAPDWDRLYLTGRGGNGLECGVIGDSCELEYVFAGVPAPIRPLRAVVDEDCGREADARAYVYTYVNLFGEESAPSLPSNIVRVNDGDPVRFPAGIPEPPEGYGITTVNLYRTATGFRPADGKVQKPLTEYLYVGSFPANGGASFSDVLQGKYLGAVLETQNDRMPPAGLRGVCAVGDQVRLAAFKDNKVFLSEPFQPHNWPAKYDLTLDYNIVHMLPLDQKLFVTTTGTPYIIDVSSCDDTRCTPVTSLDYPLADIACKYSHSAIMTYHGLIYATQHGLVLIQPNGEWHILTARWFGETEWQKIKPSSIRAAYWEGNLFFATDRATFLLNINSRPYGDMEGAELVTLSDRPVDMILSETGRLIYLEDDKIKLWAGGTKYRPYIWQSRQLTGGDDSVGNNELAMRNPARGSMWWPVSVKLGGAAKFCLFDSHEHIVYERFLTKEKPRRLPRKGRHLWYKARLSGIDTVYFLNLGTMTFTVDYGK